jgi:hypothetical protein
LPDIARYPIQQKIDPPGRRLAADKKTSGDGQLGKLAFEVVFSEVCSITLAGKAVSLKLDSRIAARVKN